MKKLIHKLYIKKKAKEFVNENGNIPIIDTHSHMLTDFLNYNLHNFVKAAKVNKLIMLNMSIDPITALDVIETNKQYPWILPSIGSHCVFYDRYKDGDLDKIKDIIKNNLTHIYAIGEIGLDYREGTSDEVKEKQKWIFEEQIKLAVEFNLPVSVHTRDSVKDITKIISKYPNVRFALHCWSGNEQETKDLLDISSNIWFGYGAKVTQDDGEISKVRQESLKLIPINRLLIETDSPSPRTYPQAAIDRKDKVNFPWLIRDSINFISKFLDMNKEDLINQLNANAIDWLNLDNDIFKLLD